MAAVVVALFAAEYALGVLPPLPGSTRAFRRLVESPAFWMAFVGNIVAGIVVAGLVTGRNGEPGPGAPPDGGDR